MIAPYLITAFVIAVVPFLPTEPVLVGMGVLAATGQANLAGVIAVAALGCVLSDHLLYAVTRLTSGGTTHLLVRGKLGRTVLGWLTRNVTRWGPPLLVAGRWLPAGGTLGALLAGLLGWKLSRFTPVSIVGSVLWSAYATMLGYVGGAVTGQPLAGLLVSLAVAVLGSLLVRSMLGRRTSDPATDPAAADVNAADGDPADGALASGGPRDGERAGGVLFAGDAAGPATVRVPARAAGAAGRAMAAVFLAVPPAGLDDADLPTVPDDAASLEPLEVARAE